MEHPQNNPELKEQERSVVEAFIDVTKLAFSKVETTAPTHPACVLAASILLEDLIELGPKRKHLTPKILRQTVVETASFPDVRNSYPVQHTHTRQKIGESIDYLIDNKLLQIYKRPGRKNNSGGRRELTNITPTPAGRNWLERYTKRV